MATSEGGLLRILVPVGLVATAGFIALAVVTAGPTPQGAPAAPTPVQADVQVEPTPAAPPPAAASLDAAACRERCETLGVATFALDDCTSVCTGVPESGFAAHYPTCSLGCALAPCMEDCSAKGKPRVECQITCMSDQQDMVKIGRASLPSDFVACTTGCIEGGGAGKK